LLISNFSPLSKIMARDAKSGDYVAPYEFMHLGGSYGCDNLGFDPFGEVVHRHKKVPALACGFRPRMSIPHMANGRGLTIGVMAGEGAR